MEEELQAPNDDKSFLKDLLSIFDGRLGRESFVRISIAYTIGLILVDTISYKIGIDKITLTVGSAIGGLILSPLYVRRLHDVGHPGYLYLMLILGDLLYVGIIISKIQLLWLFFLKIPFIFFSLYLAFWPGEEKNNKYGVPRRIRKVFFGTQWKQAKKEFLSFQGRLSRKWFFGVGVVFSILFAKCSESLILASQLSYFCRMIQSSPDPDLKAFSKIYDPFAIAAIGFFGLISILIATYIYSSLCVRRLYDIGWDRKLASIPIGIYLIYNFSTACFFFQDEFHLGRLSVSEVDKIVIFCAIVAIVQIITILILIFWPSQKGANQYGVNPVEAGLLPG